MAIHHASPGELIDIRPRQGKIEGALSKALYKSKGLEVFRLFLVAGKVIPEHRVPGELTVQCLEGIVEFTAAGSSRIMRQGDLICLEGGEPHALKGVEDGSVLVTLLLDHR
ncbi:cupin domain-containing protein [Niveibacterium microcysteis]|uniref:Cupin domain-containing protein n=1 Tax=Niveibacterium microcysteis TaxID=2811415 RepID=A0ABX7LZW1_9RHOO|nr:cupin domain-containing protein [Niveibacterium microcysteis]QSI75051.1 cupin domain-containing protein [Niveibacterium microcysteis]